jgi:hypothetical protein
VAQDENVAKYVERCKVNNVVFIICSYNFKMLYSKQEGRQGSRIHEPLFMYMNDPFIFASLFTYFTQLLLILIFPLTAITASYTLSRSSGGAKMERYETVWSFKTLNFTVELSVAPEDTDPAPEDVEAIHDGRVEWFQARVQVYYDGLAIGSDYLGACAYTSVREFFAAHRDPDPMNRNCTIMRRAGAECERTLLAFARQFLRLFRTYEAALRATVRLNSEEA